MSSNSSPSPKIEITIKAIIISLFVTIVLAASNVYLALKIGTTIAASIPAAVLSMGILKFFRRSNVFEINAIQTAASAGEGIAAAVSFVLPALIILGYWHYFHYWQTALLVGVGGILGVLFSVPLRRVMLNYPSLRFPEGTAIGSVLKASSSNNSYTRELVQGGAVGGFIALAQTGLKVLTDTVPLWFVSNKLLYGISLGFSPALLGAGYIVGFEVGMSMFIGVIIVWLLGMPILTHIYGLPSAGNTYDMAMTIWSEHIRYIGVGTMLLGGIWTLLTLIKPVIQGIKLSFKSVNQIPDLANQDAITQDRDIPMRYVLWGTLVLLILAFLIFQYAATNAGTGLLPHTVYSISLFAVFYVLVIGFIIACICGYFAGLIGSTNNPLSGMLIISVLLCSLLLLPMVILKTHIDPHFTKEVAIVMVIIIISMVASVAVIANENLQDLKAGQMIGATPWKQQVMLLAGVVVSAFVVAPVLELLLNAYGMGGVFPRPGMDPAQMLSAPQAGLMATVARGVFDSSLRWGDISAGIVIAIIGIFLDELAKKKNRRAPVLAMGLGIYLPPEIIVPTFIGGIISLLVKRSQQRQQNLTPQMREENSQRGILLACGLVAGAALMGVVLAIPFVISGNTDILSLVSNQFASVTNALSIVVSLVLCIWIYRVACCNKNKGASL
jgi:putative OPT family oligopeptide transporter